MNKPITVGITGGIGAGKTIATKIFSALNVPIYNADNRAKELMNGDLIGPISATFGNNCYANGKLNRSYLASKVFSNKKELQKLNKIVHPAVAIDFEKWVKEKALFTYVLKEAALLVEARSYKQLDKLVVVTSPQQLRIERIKKRDPHRSQKEIEDIISNQISEEEKTKLADFIIINDEKNLLIPQIIKIDKQLRNL